VVVELVIVACLAGLPMSAAASRAMIDRPPSGPPPNVIRRVDPGYPSRALSSGLSGWVMVALWLDQAAKPDSVWIDSHFSGLGSGGFVAFFDDAALAAARQWRYAWQDGDSLRNYRHLSLLFHFMSPLPLTAKDKGRVFGYLIDAVTAQPVEAATVDAEGSRLSTMTDSMGRFSFERLDPGPRTIRFIALGYERKQLPVEVRAAATDTITIRIAPRPAHISE
jgi:hypothetical protein